MIIIKQKNSQAISSEEVGMATNTNNKKDTFKPSEYTLRQRKNIFMNIWGLNSNFQIKLEKIFQTKNSNVR